MGWAVVGLQLTEPPTGTGWARPELELTDGAWGGCCPARLTVGRPTLPTEAS